MSHCSLRYGEGSHSVLMISRQIGELPLHVSGSCLLGRLPHHGPPSKTALLPKGVYPYHRRIPTT